MRKIVHIIIINQKLSNKLLILIAYFIDIKLIFLFWKLFGFSQFLL